jgi:hypothetical protein
MRAPGSVVRRTCAAAERALKTAFSHHWSDAVHLRKFWGWGWVHIRYLGNGGYWFRPDGGSL